MIEYEYEELFENHSRADILIVESGASLEWNATIHKFDVTDSSFVITNEEIDNESYNLDERLCSNEDLKFGKCEASHVDFTIYNRTTIPNLKGIVIAIFLYFNNEPDTLFEVGVYLVDEDTYTAGRKQRNISAYDWNYYLGDLDITSWYDNYFSDGERHMIGLAILSLFSWIKDENDEYPDSPKLPVSLESGYNLCNGSFTIGKTIESDTITFDFFVSGLLEFNGVFGHITREGKFRLVKMVGLDGGFVKTIDDATCIPPTNYDDINTLGIGRIDVYDRNNSKKFTVQNTNLKEPSTYTFIDPWILADREAGDSEVQQALNNLLAVINHYNYNPSETECVGDLCVEVGDRIKVNFVPTEEDTRTWFRTYVLERRFTGLQGMFDTYTAKGHKKQPKYQITNDRWHTGDSNTGTSGSGTGGVAELNDEHDRRLIEIMRNYGEPMLDEPTVTLTYNKGSSQVEIAWSDPADISTYSPLPVEWAGTVVVRKEGKAPIHRWGTEHSEYGGEVLVDSTTRDEYSQTAFVDDTIEPNKRYYYAIMPYFVALDDAQHPIKHYRWTKVFSVDTARILVAPTLFPIQETAIQGTNVTVGYSLPVLEVGSYELIKLVAKKDAIPKSISDGDRSIDLTPTPGMVVNTATMTGLDENSHYYFVIFIEDEQNNTASSEPQSCKTGESIVPSDLRPYVDRLASTNFKVSSGDYTYTLLSYMSSTGNSNTWTIDDSYSFCLLENEFDSEYNNNKYHFYVLEPLTINVVVTDETVRVTYPYTLAPNGTIHVWGRGTFGPYDESGNFVDFISGRGELTLTTSVSYKSALEGQFTTSFNSMLECVQYLTNHFRHCALKVNGVYWLDLFEHSYQHLFTNVNMNNQAETYTFDTALMNWYNAGLSEQTSHISGTASSHISLSNSYFKIDNYPFAERSGTIDFGGGWTLEYSFGAVTHTYNRDIQEQLFILKYNGSEIQRYIAGGTTSSEWIITFEDNGDETASLLFFHTVGEYMYDQIYDWSTWYFRIKTTNSSLLNYIRRNQN